MKNSILILFFLFITSCTSFQDRVKNDGIVGTAWYCSLSHSTVYFADSKVILSVFNGSVYSEFSVRLSREEKGYTYNKSQRTGTIDGIPFNIKEGNYGLYIMFLGELYILDQKLSINNS
jgi:hypothetical protein